MNSMKRSKNYGIKNIIYNSYLKKAIIRKMNFFNRFFGTVNDNIYWHNELLKDFIK